MQRRRQLKVVTRIHLALVSCVVGFASRQGQSGQVRSECLTCIFRASYCSARLSRVQGTGHRRFLCPGREIWRTLHVNLNTILNNILFLLGKMIGAVCSPTTFILRVGGWVGGGGGAGRSSGRAFGYGVPIELFLVPASAPRLV